MVRTWTKAVAVEMGRRHRAGEIMQRLTGRACSGSALQEGDIRGLEMGLPW